MEEFPGILEERVKLVVVMEMPEHSRKMVIRNTVPDGVEYQVMSPPVRCEAMDVRANNPIMNAKAKRVNFFMFIWFDIKIRQNGFCCVRKNNSEKNDFSIFEYLVL